MILPYTTEAKNEKNTKRRRSGVNRGDTSVGCAVARERAHASRRRRLEVDQLEARVDPGGGRVQMGRDSEMFRMHPILSKRTIRIEDEAGRRRRTGKYC